MSLTVQYIVLGVILAGAVGWVIFRIVRMRKRKETGCCGCSLYETCGRRVESGRRRVKRREGCRIYDKPADAKG